MKKQRYPGRRDAEEQRRSKPAPVVDDAPDFIAGAPNYEKFGGWSAEEVLVWLNID